MTVTEVAFLDEWHDLLLYVLEYLSPSNNWYLKTWRRIFNCSRASCDFKNILLVIEIAFCMPVSAAVCERSFSLLKRIKTDTRSNLGADRLENLIRICLEDPPLKSFDVMPAINKWADSKIRRPSQKKRQRAYKRASLKKVIGLSDSSSSLSEDKES